MKRIETYIAHYLEQRLQRSSVLVIYDPANRYKEIAAELINDHTWFIDGSTSTIAGREQALSLWCRMGQTDHEQDRMIIYLPARRPVSEQQKQQNPYQIFALGGGEFPESDSESLFGLCLQAAPELRGPFEKLFQQGEPDFAAINQLINGSTNWPKLKSLLKVESSAEILLALLSPDAQQAQRLTRDAGWCDEYKSFCAATLAFTPADGGYDEIARELWRFILFSEFAFDLPEALPTGLQQVPRANEAAQSLIFRVCEDLRGTERHQMLYMQRAEEAAAALRLEQHLAAYKNLGHRDTFAFEERTFLHSFCEAVATGAFETCEDIITHRRGSLWVRHLPERQQLWILAERALQLLTLTNDLEPELHKTRPDANALIDFYVSRFRIVDRAYRNLEAAVVKAYGDLTLLEGVIEQARQSYGKTSERLQSLFIAAVEKEGWPASGRLRNSEVFDKVVAPLLSENKRTALFMVDALRYELAAELENELSSRYQTKLEAACAQLPTVTVVGMASLLPFAQTKMEISIEKGAIIPSIDGRMIRTPADRFAYLQSIYGDRCLMNDLNDLLAGHRINVEPHKQLWVIKTTDIDDMGTMSPFEARQFISLLLRKLIAAIRVVKQHKFDQAVVVTDHGFILLHEQAAGDVAAKPLGEWTVTKERFLLGTGSGNASVAAFSPQEAGIRGTFKTYAVPKTFAAFSKGKPYYHGGLSLQEALLPVLVISLDTKKAEEKPRLEIALQYRKGTSRKITTRRPMIEVSIFSDSLFGGDATFQLEAFAGQRQVGEAAASEYINPDTNWITLQSGQAVRISLRMEEDYHGAFQVRAFDPVTHLTYATLDLETDYVD